MRSASAKRQGLKESDIDEALANYESSPRFDEAAKLALRYSEWMALDPERIDAGFYERLRRHYSDEEIVELGAFIGFNVGYHTFFGSLKFYPMFAPDGRLVSQEESARIYGDVPVSLQSPGSSSAETSETVAARTGASPNTPDGPCSASLSPDTALPGASPHRLPRASRDQPSVNERPIKPLRLDEIGDEELKALIVRCTALGVPDENFPGILARVPNHANALLQALLHSHTEGNVDHRLKEIIRILLARTAGDAYFAGLRSKRAAKEGLDEETIEAGCGAFDADPRFDDAEKWALRYAHTLYRTPEAVDAAFYAEGKRHYSEAQIMELGAFIAFHYGMQVFMRSNSDAFRST